MGEPTSLPAQPLRVAGTNRPSATDPTADPRTLVFHFNRPPSDEEWRMVHDAMRATQWQAFQRAPETDQVMGKVDGRDPSDALDHLQSLSDRATPGEWDTDTGGDVTSADGTTVLTRAETSPEGLERTFVDAELAASAVNFVRWALKGA